MEGVVAFAAFERRFVLADLDLMAVAVALPTRSGTFGLGVQNFGFEEFRQQKIGLTYARPLSKMLYLGGQINYFNTRIPEYGSNGSLTFDLGLQAEISDELVLGAFIGNPAQLEFAEGENLPTVMKFGASYLPSKKVNVGFELEKDVDFPLRVRAGLEYQAAEPLTVRTGFSSDPGTFHFGLGLRLANGLVVDTAMRYHQTLGLTPSVGLRFEGKAN